MAPNSSSSSSPRQQPDLAVYRLATAAAAGGAALMLPPPPTQPSDAPLARRFTTGMWFEAMIQTAVKQLQPGSAFLLRVGFNPALRLELVRLGAADLAAGWEHIQQQHLRPRSSSDRHHQHDEALILVHPVAATDQPCLVQQSGGGACPGCPHDARHPQPWPAAAAAIAAAAAADAAAAGGGVTAAWQPQPAGAGAAAPAASELLHGTFGDCCGGDDGSNHHHHDHHHGSHHGSHDRHGAAAAAAAAAQQPRDPVTAYWGLVVQCRQADDPLQGCYLLKTVHQAGAGAHCQCTHYSLNRVCKGPSLAQQFQEAWLV
jgi:hypothetical protein